MKAEEIINDNVILECIQVNKFFRDSKHNIQILDNVDLTIKSKQKIAIVGPSGSGKSTLLHMLGGLDKPSSGVINVTGKSWWRMSESQRCSVRNTDVGFVYQFHHLMPDLTAWENVALPLYISKYNKQEIKNRVDYLLRSVNLEARREHYPAQLSGGEKQRIAIARALAVKPRVLLADEPTGNLDQVTAQKIFHCLVEASSIHSMALVIVTHDLNLAYQMDEQYTIKQQKLLKLSATSISL